MGSHSEQRVKRKGILLMNLRMVKAEIKSFSKSHSKVTGILTRVMPVEENKNKQLNNNKKQVSYKPTVHGN